MPIEPHPNSGRTPAASAAPARVLARRYRLGPRIGVGGSAEVLLGHDTTLGRDVAIKVLRAPFSHDPASIDRLDREAEVAAMLSHRAVVSVYERGREGDLHFLVMELVRGTSLRAVLRDHVILAPAQVATVLSEVLGALGAAHRLDLVHRDVKPENVLVSHLGEIKLTDFGIATRGSSATGPAHHRRVEGTAAYVAPELLRGEGADARSDLFAAGVLAAEALTGRVPQGADGSARIARPSASNPTIPAAIDEWVASMIEPDRTFRPASAEEAARDLTTVARSLTPAPPISSLVTLPTALRRS